MRRYHLVRLLLLAGLIAAFVYYTGRSRYDNTPGAFDDALSFEEHDKDEPANASACDEDYRSKLTDLAVILKTGASDNPDNLDYQLKNTLQCLENLIVFADFAETFEGTEVHDALEDYNEDIKTNMGEFELWRRLHDNGRQGLQASDFVKDAPKYKGSPGSGNGWKLDKWKFLPMAKKSLAAFPQAKWFLWMEADTYISFWNMYHWLQHLDSTKPYYYGNPTVIGKDLFGHGGSGFLISQPAMKTVVDYYAEHEHELHQLTANHWAGDCVLGMALARSGVGLTGYWPYFQQEGLWNLDPGASIGQHNRRWCKPLISLHHMSLAELQNMHAYEQSFLSHNPSSPYTQGRLFNEMILPSLSPLRTRWKNPYDGNDWAGNPKIYREDNSGSLGSEAERNAHKSVGDCRALCEAQQDCLQFFFEEGTCFTTHQFGAGRADPNSKGEAGWLVERINAYINALPPCEEPLWEPRFARSYAKWLHSVSGAAEIQPIDPDEPEQAPPPPPPRPPPPADKKPDAAPVKEEKKEAEPAPAGNAAALLNANKEKAQEALAPGAAGGGDA